MSQAQLSRLLQRCLPCYHAPREARGWQAAILRDRTEIAPNGFEFSFHDISSGSTRELGNTAETTQTTPTPQAHLTRKRVEV